MARRVFFSFHYEPDSWRASQVRNIGVVDGNSPVTDNDWERVTRGGDAAIERWIEQQLNGKSCTMLLIGENTAGRKWIDYEIRRSWDLGKGVVGIYIHNLKNRDGDQAARGRNPFQGSPLAQIVRAYDPPFRASTDVYDYIGEMIERWVDEAVEIRSRYTVSRATGW